MIAPGFNCCPMKQVLSIIVIFLLGALGCNKVTRPLMYYAVHGIDVSHHQKRILWDSVATTHIDFVYVKASEGVTWKDTLFQENWSELRRVGLFRGAYHFFRPDYDGKAQAENFLEQVKLRPGDLAPVLDVEVLDNASKVTLLKEMYAWLYWVELRTGVKPVIYTNQKFYNDYLSGYFSDYPLWIARYNTKTPFLVDCRDWNFWQYGDQGRLKGIEGNVDFNVFFSDLADLENHRVSAPIVEAFGP